MWALWAVWGCSLNDKWTVVSDRHSYHGYFRRPQNSGRADHQCFGSGCESSGCYRALFVLTLLSSLIFLFPFVLTLFEPFTHQGFWEQLGIILEQSFDVTVFFNSLLFCCVSALLLLIFLLYKKYEQILCI